MCSFCPVGLLSHRADLDLGKLRGEREFTNVLPLMFSGVKTSSRTPEGRAARFTGQLIPTEADTESLQGGSEPQETPRLQLQLLTDTGPVPAPENAPRDGPNGERSQGCCLRVCPGCCLKDF